jgi:hypothetical protein
MRKLVLFVTLSISLLGGSALPTQVSLQDIIPVSKWQRTGLHRLTDTEREELKNEILRVIAQLRRNSIAVIAPSLSTQRVARQVLIRLGKGETKSFRDAEAILVVVRSSLYYPLNLRYDSLNELRRSAEMQLNLSGPKYHVYLYLLEHDLTLRQLAHESFDAEKE